MTKITESNATPRQSWKSYALSLENRLAHLEDEHVQLQADHHRLQEDSKLLVEQAPYAMYEIEFYGKRFTRVNDTMCRISGYSREELLSMNPLDLLDDDGRRTFQDRLRMVLAGETVEPEVEYSITGKNGRQIYALLTTSLRYVDGNPHSYFVIAHDITERRQMEDALRESQHKTSQVLESISDAFYSLDQEGRFIYVNRKALSLWEKQPEDLIGRNLWEVFPSGIHTESYTKIQQALVDKQPTHYETYSAYLNRWTEINLYPTETGLSVYFQDITERKQVEQALKQKNMMLTLLADAASELLAGADPIDKLDEFFTRAGEALGLEVYVQYNLSEDGTCLKLGRIAGFPDRYLGILSRLQLGQAVCGTVALTRQPMYVTNVQDRKDKMTRLIRKLGLGTYACHPLMVGDRLFGTLSFGSRTHSQFDPQTIGILKTFCTMVAEAMARKQAEETIRRSETLYRMLAGNLPNGAAFLVDHDLHYLLAEGQALHAAGFTSSHFEGKTIWEAPDPGLVTHDEADYRRVLGGETFHSEFHSLGRDYLSWGVPVLDEQGKVVAALALSFDITERKEVEQSLQESEERERLRAAQMEAVLEALPVGVSITDDQGKIIQANHAYEQVWGNRRAHYQSVHDYHDNKAWWADTGKPLRSEEWASAQAVQHGKAVIGQVLEIQRFDGSKGYVLNSASPVHDDLGNIFGSAVAIQDITRLRLAEQELKEANLLLEQRVDERTQELQQMYDRVRLLAEVYDLLTAAGPDLPVILDSVVRKTSEIFGGACVLRLLNENGQWLAPAATYDPDPDRAEELANSLKSTPQPRNEQLAGDISNLGAGQIFQVTDMPDWDGFEAGDFVSYLKASRATSLMVVPLRIGQEAIGTLALVDYTPEKAHTQEELVFLQELADRAALAIHNARLYKDLEHSLSKERDLRQQLIQSEKYAALARLVGSVAHELNNPLQAIQNCVFLLKDASPPGEPQELVEMINSETRRMSMLVQQLRVTYRPSRFNYENFDVLEVMAQAFNLLAPKLHQNKVEWGLNSTHPHIFLYGISDQIKQVFINIILNAIEALGEDGGNIYVSVSLHDDHVSITFEDTGCGIYPDDLGKLFEPFYTTKESGTGLGLPICYEIVKNHQGEISVESTLGKGAKFFIQLPLAPSNQVEP